MFAKNYHINRNVTTLTLYSIKISRKAGIVRGSHQKPRASSCRGDAIMTHRQGADSECLFAIPAIRIQNHPVSCIEEALENQLDLQQCLGLQHCMLVPQQAKCGKRASCWLSGAFFLFRSAVIS